MTSGWAQTNLKQSRRASLQLRCDTIYCRSHESRGRLRQPHMDSMDGWRRDAGYTRKPINKCSNPLINKQALE